MTDAPREGLFERKTRGERTKARASVARSGRARSIVLVSAVARPWVRMGARALDPGPPLTPPTRQTPRAT